MRERTINKSRQQGRFAPGPLNSGPCLKRYVTTMMKLLPLLLIMPVYAAAFDLNGTWIQDKEASIEFNKKHSKLTPLAEKLYECANETLLFNNGSANLVIEDFPCEYEGKKATIEGTNLEWQYREIAESSDSIILESTSAENEVSFATYHFVAPDQIWVYSGGSGIMESSHVRTYYKRAK